MYFRAYCDPYLLSPQLPWRKVFSWLPEVVLFITVFMQICNIRLTTAWRTGKLIKPTLEIIFTFLVSLLFKIHLKMWIWLAKLSRRLFLRSWHPIQSRWLRIMSHNDCNTCPIVILNTATQISSCWSLTFKFLKTGGFAEWRNCPRNCQVKSTHKW